MMRQLHYWIMALLLMPVLCLAGFNKNHDSGRMAIKAALEKAYIGLDIVYVKIKDYHTSNGTLPTEDAFEETLSDSSLIKTLTNTPNGAAIVTFGEHAPKPLIGQSIAMTPTVSSAVYNYDVKVIFTTIGSKNGRSAGSPYGRKVTPNYATSPTLADTTFGKAYSIDNDSFNLLKEDTSAGTQLETLQEAADNFDDTDGY